MNIIVHSYPRAEENLAYEEWLFQHFDDAVLRLWVNPRSVIVGKHQNAMAEANVPYCLAEHIPIVRRISGGGTVYHDPGNINFSFFRPVEAEKMIDYERNLRLIQAALQSMGYPVEMNARHDLFLGENKISGNAQHLRRGRALHHGTILYDADRSVLGKSIKRSSGTYTDKSVKSVRSPIDNLKHYRSVGDASAFIDALTAALIQQDITPMAPPLPERAALESLIKERYSQEDWNYGYSPKFRLERSTTHFEVDLEVERGGTINRFDVRGKTIDFAPIGKPSLFFPSAIQDWVQAQQLPSAELRKELLEVLL